MSDYQEGGPVHVAAMEFRIHQLEQENERLKEEVKYAYARDPAFKNLQSRLSAAELQARSNARAYEDWKAAADARDDLQSRLDAALRESGSYQSRLSAVEERYRDEALRSGRLATDLERVEAERDQARADNHYHLKRCIRAEAVVESAKSLEREVSGIPFEDLVAAVGVTNANVIASKRQQAHEAIRQYEEGRDG